MVQALLAAAREWTRCGDLFPGPKLAQHAGRNRASSSAGRARGRSRRPRRGIRAPPDSSRPRTPECAMDPAVRARLEQVYARAPADGGRRARAGAAKPRHARRDPRARSRRSRGRWRDRSEPRRRRRGESRARGGRRPRAWVHGSGHRHGLGGTPRLLAEEFGCRCHGVELTTSRFRRRRSLDTSRRSRRARDLQPRRLHGRGHSRQAVRRGRVPGSGDALP